MNRLFRSAFVPLIVIVVLVWLASQTLIPKSHHSVKQTTSQVLTAVQKNPQSISEIDFNPNKAVGLDGALAKLAHASYGPFMLGIVAAGLIAFGMYSLSDARYRRI